ncbi:MAG: DUF1801 domain-containing protein [Candidatus Andersenbacteria bacterium]
MAGKKPAKLASVSAYIAAAPAQARPMLRQLRALTRAAAPRAAEGISYRIPYYSYHGRLVYFGAFSNHCSLFVASGSTLRAFARELRGYKISTGTLQFPFGTKLPGALIKKLVKARVKENERRVG